MQGKFFTFIRPFLNFIDNGHFFRNPFKWLYILLGVVNLLVPVYLLYEAVDKDLFDAPAKYVFGFLFVWLVISFTCWLCFQVWWDRKDKIAMYSRPGDEFIASPVFSHFIQTLGETYGILVGVLGFAIALVGLISSDSNELYRMGREIVPFLGAYGGIAGLVIMPVLGFLIVVIFRFLAELIRSLAAIANNTRAAKAYPAAVPGAEPELHMSEAHFEPIE